jgi:integrase
MKTILEDTTTATHQETQNRNSVACPQDVEKFIIEALTKRKPSLIRFAVLSPAVVEMAKYLKRHCSQSHATMYLYVWSVQGYCKWRGSDPDQLIAECFSQDGLPNQKALQLEARNLDDYIGSLQSEEYSPGHISNCVKAVKTLYRINGLNLCLPYKLHKYVVTKDRSPTPEELSRLVDIADIRGKLIVAMLAQGGFRLGTLCKLRYRHIREDFERNIIPIHIHVEAKITKGKYHDYDTFLGKEAVDYLRAYLEARKAGGLPNKIPPETIQDESPLIRSEHAKEVKALSPGQIYNVLHRLMAQAGFLGSKVGRRYTVRPHSIRKFFRTQMAALGAQTDYIEYMMGHTISTYHDIEMKGIEFLRAEYAKAGLSIKPKSETNKMAIVRDFLKSMNLNPEEVLSKEAQAMPHRTVIDYSHKFSEQEQIDTMLRALMQKMKHDIIAETQMINQKTV